MSTITERDIQLEYVVSLLRINDIKIRTDRFLFRWIIEEKNIVCWKSIRKLREKILFSNGLLDFLKDDPREPHQIGKFEYYELFTEYSKDE